MITFTQLDTGILVMEESDIEVNLISHVTVNYILFVCRIGFEGMIIADKTYAIQKNNSNIQKMIFLFGL